MAQTQTQTNAGKPAKAPSKNPREAALSNLQYALDRACSFIHDGGSSYARRARSAARQEVPKEKVLKGLDAMTAAIADARTAIDRAYAAPTKTEAPKSRVQLI